MKKFALLITALATFSSLHAETRYVTDEFRAPLRSGQTNAYRIKAELKSGTAVELVQSNAETGYSQVKTNRGTEGWILTRYLVDQPIARDRLANAQRQLNNSVGEKRELIANQEELKLATQDLQKDNQSLQEINTKLLDELTYIKQISGNAVTINQRNQQLIEENQQLQNKVELLTAENDRLKDDSNQDFFLYGAGTILLGLILGLTIPSFRPKRKDPGWV